MRQVIPCRLERLDNGAELDLDAIFNSGDCTAVNFGYHDNGFWSICYYEQPFYDQFKPIVLYRRDSSDHYYQCYVDVSQWTFLSTN